MKSLLHIRQSLNVISYMTRACCYNSLPGGTQPRPPLTPMPTSTLNTPWGPAGRLRTGVWTWQCQGTIRPRWHQPNPDGASPRPDLRLHIGLALPRPCGTPSQPQPAGPGLPSPSAPAHHLPTASQEGDVFNPLL